MKKCIIVFLLFSSFGTIMPTGPAFFEQRSPEPVRSTDNSNAYVTEIPSARGDSTLSPIWLTNPSFDILKSLAEKHKVKPDIHQRLQKILPKVMFDKNLYDFLVNAKRSQISSRIGCWPSWQAKNIADLLAGCSGNLQRGTKRNTWRINDEHEKAILVLSKVAKHLNRGTNVKTLNPTQRPNNNNNNNSGAISRISSSPQCIFRRYKE